MSYAHYQRKNKYHQPYPTVNSLSYNDCPSKKKRATGTIASMTITGMTNHFLIGSMAHSTRGNPYLPPLLTQEPMSRQVVGSKEKPITITVLVNRLLNWLLRTFPYTHRWWNDIICLQSKTLTYHFMKYLPGKAWHSCCRWSHWQFKFSEQLLQLVSLLQICSFLTWHLV